MKMITIEEIYCVRLVHMKFSMIENHNFVVMRMLWHCEFGCHENMSGCCSNGNQYQVFNLRWRWICCSRHIAVDIYQSPILRCDRNLWIRARHYQLNCFDVAKFDYHQMNSNSHFVQLNVVGVAVLRFSRPKCHHRAYPHFISPHSHAWVHDSVLIFRIMCDLSAS